MLITLGFLLKRLVICLHRSQAKINLLLRQVLPNHVLACKRNCLLAFPDSIKHNSILLICSCHENSLREVDDIRRLCGPEGVSAAAHINMQSEILRNAPQRKDRLCAFVTNHIAFHIIRVVVIRVLDDERSWPNRGDNYDSGVRQQPAL